MGIGKILSELLKERKISESELARQVGVTPSTINSIVQRDSTKVNITTLTDICKALSVSPEVFFEDYIRESPRSISPSDLKMLEKYHELDVHGKSVVEAVLQLEYKRCTVEVEEDNLIKFPKSLLKASAGTGAWLEEEYKEWVYVPDTPTARQANIVIEVSGDSMEPLFSDGDNVLVRLTPDIEQGEIGIFSVDNEAFIKRKGNGELVSLNPDYRNIELTEYSAVKCFGKVLGKTEVK